MEAKLIYGNRSQESGCFWEVMTGRNYGGFGDTYNILLFELNIGYAQLCSEYENSLNWILWFMHFSVIWPYTYI